jgi:hypothetical protein
VDIGSQRFLHQDNQPVSRHAGVADGQNRSWRPLYVMVAIVIVAMAGIAVSFGLNSRLSGPLEIASFKADNGPAKQQTEATSRADVPAQDAAILSKPPEPSPMAPVNSPKQTIDLPQVEEKTLPAESHAQIDNRPPAVPSAPAQAQTPAEPFYGGNSLRKAMPRRTKLCYGCRLGTIVLHGARHHPHDRQREAPDPERPA